MSAYRLYWSLFGIRGIAALTAERLLGVAKEFSVAPPGSCSHVSLRTRTSDVSLYRIIFVQEEYGATVPFSPRVIIDAGANIGLTSVFFANRYPRATIVAIEPEGRNFEMLLRNTKAYRQIIPVRAALWHRDGEITLAADTTGGEKYNQWGFSVRDGGDGVAVPAFTLPTILDSYEIDTIDILKVDIEGAEKEVFETCDWIDRVRCLMIETHDRRKPGCTAAVEQHVGGFSKTRRGDDLLVYLRSELTARDA